MKSSPWILLMASVISGALGQLFMKAGMQDLNPNDSSNTLLDSLQSILFFNADMSTIYGTLWLLAGILCYLLAMMIWIYVLKSFDLSMAYPLLSIGYILVYLGAVAWPKIGEDFLWEKTTGILLIMLGVILIASPKEPSASKPTLIKNKKTSNKIEPSTSKLSSIKET